MEIKSGHKAASVSFFLIMLIGYIDITPQFFSVVWANPGDSLSPSVSIFPSESPTILKKSEFESVTDEDKKEIIKMTKNDLIPLGLGVLSIFGLWNLALTFMVFRTIKYYDEKIKKNNQKFKDLETRDVSLDQRISRKSALIDELKGQLASYKKTLEFIQIQAQPKSKRANNDILESRNQPVNYAANEPFVSQDYDYKSRQSNYSQSAPVASDPWNSLVQNYNLSPQVLESYVIDRVSESEESVVSRRENSNAVAFLKAANNYSYCIYTGEDRSYWLMPKNDFKITPIGFDTLQALFECPEYQQGSRIQIIKPAKVDQNSFSSGWDLIEKGQVQFMR